MATKNRAPLSTWVSVLYNVLEADLRYPPYLTQHWFRILTGFRQISQKAEPRLVIHCLESITFCPITVNLQNTLSNYRIIICEPFIELYLQNILSNFTFFIFIFKIFSICHTINDYLYPLLHTLNVELPLHRQSPHNRQHNFLHKFDNKDSLFVLLNDMVQKKLDYSVFSKLQLRHH